MEEKLKAIKYDVKTWNPIALWSWNVEIENCAICKNHIMERCIEC